MAGMPRVEADPALDLALLRGGYARETARLASLGVDLSGDLAVERYIQTFDDLRSPIAYDHVPAEARQTCAALAASGGDAAVESFHRLVLLRLIEGFEARALRVGLPDWLRARTLAFLHDLQAGLWAKRRRLTLDQDSFLKDLAVCRLKLWPVGAELLDIASGVPRRPLLQGGAGHALAAFAYLSLSLRGFKPFYETHFDDRHAKGFSPDGYRDLYVTIGRLLRVAPMIKGVFSGSWWHDPAVAKISPNLAFLNELPLAGGARIFPLGTDPHTIKAATRLSQERAQLVQDGSYQPTNYLLVWGRDELLRWADRQTAGRA